MHKKAGNIAFSDGSAEKMITLKLQRQAANPPDGAKCGENHVLAPCESCSVTNP
jgi:prepilin-type processing-associated H-X9-DG protein